MNNTTYQILNPDDDLSACFAIRRQVFIVEQSCPEAEEFDGLDSSAIHFLALSEQTPVATARLRIIDGYAKFERLAVLKEYRSRGIGQQLLEFVLEYIDARNYPKTLIHAQSHLENFYYAFGFRAYGDEFIEAGIRHIHMQRMS